MKGRINMARDLLPSYKDAPQHDLLENESPEDEQNANIEKLAKEKFPKAPDWLREAMLKMAKNPNIAEFANKAAPYAEKFNQGVEATGLPKLVAPIASAELGAAQGIGNMGASVLNTPAYLKELATGEDQERLQMPDLSQYADQGALSRLGFGAGELVGPLAIPFGAAGKAASYAGKVGTGGLTAFLTGEDEKGSRLANTVIGAALPGAVETAKDFAKLMPKSIAKDVVKVKNMLEKKYTKGYERFKSVAEERGANKPELRQLSYDNTSLDPFMTKESKHAISEFNKNPTVHQAHELQSDLGKNIGELSSGNLSFIEKQRLKELKELRNDVKSRIREHLVKSGNSDLAQEYIGLSQGYKQDVVPYLRKHVAQAEKDILNGDSPAEAIKKMVADSEFIKAIKGSHHGLENRAALKKVWEAVNPIRHLIQK